MLMESLTVFGHTLQVPSNAYHAGAQRILGRTRLQEQGTRFRLDFAYDHEVASAAWLGVYAVFKLQVVLAHGVIISVLRLQQRAWTREWCLSRATCHPQP